MHRGIVIFILLGISGSGGEIFSTIKQMIPRMQVDRKAVKRSPVIKSIKVYQACSTESLSVVVYIVKKIYCICLYTCISIGRNTHILNVQWQGDNAGSNGSSNRSEDSKETESLPAYLVRVEELVCGLISRVR